MLFKDLSIGDSFDWTDDANRYLRCAKTSSHTYVDSDGLRHLVGSVRAKVFHVHRLERAALLQLLREEQPGTESEQIKTSGS